MNIELQKQLVEIYKTLHQMPQIGLQQYKTTKFITDYVQKIQGAQIVKPQQDSQLKTGLIVVVKAQIATNLGFLFRCDIDALKFLQQSGLEYISKNGLHHACGHDAHTAIMLLSLKIIASKKSQLKRNIYFCFQPGEEGHGGASKLLYKHPNLFQHISNCFALHVGNHKLKNKLMIPKQYVTANSNRFQIQIFGKSAHCMVPHSAIDANYIGCQIVNQIYSLKSRIIKPDVGLAIAVTKLQGGNQNLTSISGYMKINGSIRSFSRQFHQKTLQFILKYTKAICELNGANYNFKKNDNWYRAVRNQQPAINIVKKAAQGLFQQIQYVGPSYAGEDFCEFSEKKPSCYFILGVGLPQSINSQTSQSKFPIHSNKFKLDESSLKKGCQLWLNIAFS